MRNRNEGVKLQRKTIAKQYIQDGPTFETRTKTANKYFYNLLPRIILLCFKMNLEKEKEEEKGETDCMQPAKPKIFAIWSFKRKCLPGPGIEKQIYTHN